MPLKNLKPCPNPKCTNPNSENVNVEIEKLIGCGPFMGRSRITCRYCSYSSGWWDNFHEMVAWWNKWARPRPKKETVKNCHIMTATVEHCKSHTCKECLDL